MSRRRARSSQPNTAASGRSAFPWRALLIVLAGALAYSNTLSAPFVFDDQTAIVANPAIRSPWTVFSQQTDSPLAGRPAAALSFALNFAVDELNVRGYHLTNIAIHLACALLIFGIVRRTLMLPRFRQSFAGAAPNFALAVSLLWVVHPLNTEAVTYITERTESLMALCYLLTVYASLRAYLTQRPLLWTTTAILSCAIGMACKESMATAPLIVLLYDRMFLFDSMPAALKARWRLYGGLALTWLVLLYLILPGPRRSSAGFSTSVSPWTYLLNQTRMIVRYLQLVFWPRDLVTYYGAPAAVTLGSVLPYAFGITVLLFLTLAALRLMPAAGFLAAAVFITLAPASSFIPIATEVGAERRMYLPLIGIVALIVFGLHAIEAIRQRVTSRQALAFLAIFTALLGAGTLARNQEYESGLRLAQTSLARWPNDFAHSAVGSELALLHRDAEALPELRLGAATNARARYNLGVTLFNLKQFDAAIAELQRLVDEFPAREEVPWARRTMGHALVLQRKWPQAISELRIALSMTSGDAQTRTVLTSAYFGQGVELVDGGRFAEAAQSFRDALTYDPGSISLRHNLAAALLDSGDAAAGLAEAQRTLAQHPADADSYVLIGRALATQGKFDEAIPALEQALRLKPDDASIRDDLQRVLAARRRI